jgi:hypothetical protein
VVGSDTVVDSPVAGTGSGFTVLTDAGPGPVDPAVTHRPRAEGGTEVVYPSGIIVAAEEHPLYQRATDGGREASEVYLPLLEPELADDGTEHDMVTYCSSAGTSYGPA